MWWCLTPIPTCESIWGSLWSKVRLLNNHWSKIFEKITYPQALSVVYLVFYYISLKFSLYIVLEAKCVRHWKSETHWWAHWSLSSKRNQTVNIWHVLPPLTGDDSCVCPDLNHPLHLLTYIKGLLVLPACRPIEAGCRFSQLSC